jgi:hypothetical protein
MCFTAGSSSSGVILSQGAAVLLSCRTEFGPSRPGPGIRGFFFSERILQKDLTGVNLPATLRRWPRRFSPQRKQPQKSVSRGRRFKPGFEQTRSRRLNRLSTEREASGCGLNQT